uniref:Integrase, catalytic region, zinc finger, CCHC-type, peptidase aspartic, catalytic n=1 Tax=Tanacetum cinerariifolium TaxID=118510 RepID=A0A6L2NJI3_TANCI|nr:hypothetical protein [Tanacetum cinerariifolium]
MLAPGNYVQWKSIIKRYIDTKPNHELIYYYLKNPPYKYTWADKTVPVSEGSSETTIVTYMENYKNVSQDIRDQLNAKAEAVQIYLMGIDNDIYSIVDACPNACEMWKAIKRLKQGESINVQDLETNLYWEFRNSHHGMSQELKTVSYHKLYDILKQHQNEVNEIRAERIACTANALALVAQQQPVYHPQNHPTHYTQNSSTRSQQAATRNREKVIVNSPPPIYDQEPSMVVKDDEIANQDNSLRINRGTGYDNQRLGNVVGARETVDQELEAHYLYMAQIQEVSPDAADSGPIFDADPLQKVSNDDHYNVFAIEHMSYDREQIDPNDDDDDLANERELLASLIEKLKCEIDDSKNQKKYMETSNKVLVEKLKGEIKDFKTKNKSLESSNNHFKEANNKLSETNALMYKDLKKSQVKLDRRNDVEYASKMEIDCAKAKGDLISYKMESQNKCRTSFAKPEFLKKAQRANPRLYDIGCYNDNLALMLAPESDDVIRLEKESRSKLSDLIRPFDYDKLNNLYDLFVPQREKSSKQIYFLERSRMSHTPVNNRNSKESFNKQTTLLEKRMDESILWDQKCKRSKELFKIKRRVGTIFDGVERCKETIAKRTYFGHIDPFIQNTIEANFYSLISQLETQKTHFLNEIDRLSREYYYADHMNAILGVYTELDEVTNLQCDYLELLEKYECLEKELSKSKMMSTSFEALQKHAINLEIDLQQCQEKITNDKYFKEKQSKELRKEREKYFEIQDLKAQLQDKGIAISKPTIFSDSLERKDFSKSKSVTKNNVSDDFSKPVTAQILPPNKKSILKNINVLALGMYELHKKPTQTRTTQLPNDSRKSNKRVSFSTRVIPTTSVSRPKLKSNPMKDRVLLNNSQGKKPEVEDHHRNVKFSKNKIFVTACNDSLKAKTSNVNFVCATRGKCMLNDKHDMCVLKSLDGVNSRTKMPIVVLVSTRKPKSTVKQSVAKLLRKTVASESNQKLRNTTRKLYERISKACSWWYPKFTPSRYSWKLKSKIGNVKPNVSMPLGNASRTANVLDPMTSRYSTVSNTPLSSNSFAARRDYPIHHRLWVLKAHDEKSQASN